MDSFPDDFVEGVTRDDCPVMLRRQRQLQVARGHVASVVSVEDHFGGAL
jgi:hypothetical protein